MPVATGITTDKSVLNAGESSIRSTMAETFVRISDDDQRFVTVLRDARFRLFSCKCQSGSKRTKASGILSIP